MADCALPCLVAGGTLHFMEQFEPAACLSLMARERITIRGSVPSTFPMILDLPEFGDADLSAVELIARGGAAMAEGVIARLVRLRPRLATNYGLPRQPDRLPALENGSHNIGCQIAEPEWNPKIVPGMLCDRARVSMLS